MLFKKYKKFMNSYKEDTAELYQKNCECIGDPLHSIQTIKTDCTMKKASLVTRIAIAVPPNTRYTIIHIICSFLFVTKKPSMGYLTCAG